MDALLVAAQPAEPATVSRPLPSAGGTQARQVEAARVRGQAIPALAEPALSLSASAPVSGSLHPEQIHPGLWRGHQLGRSHEAVLTTGWPTLDRELPSGGWPRRVLTELLLRQPGVGEMRLLAPALSAVAATEGLPGRRPDPDGGRSVMLIDPPATPCAWALTQLGLDDRRLIVVHGREGPRGAALRHVLASADLLWALEQALRSGHVGAIVAWLPDRLRADALRRLQLAAQAHDGPVFLMRGIEARQRPSPAPLRLTLHAAGADHIGVQVLKRRGPPMTQVMRLSLPPPGALRRGSVQAGTSVRVAEQATAAVA